MNARARVPAVIALAIGLTLGASSLPPVLAVTKAEVEAACADSKEALTDYRAARAQFNEAVTALEAAQYELESSEARAERIQALYDRRQDEKNILQGSMDEQAVEMYMETVAGAPTFLLLSSPEQALTSVEFLGSTARDTMGVINDISSISGELDRLTQDLASLIVDLSALRDQQQQRSDELESTMASALDSYERLSDRCRESQAQYEAEQARIREEQERQRRAAAATSPPEEGPASSGRSRQTVNGLVCPFTPGRTQFIDSWGFPRSGGRRHQGVDMFAVRGEPVYAVSSGVVTIANGGLGGKTIWLTADSGVAFYYAHLDGWAVGSGQRVEQGQLIAYNGNSGNAMGTSPHVHLQIHPSGRGGAPINPYPSMAAVCF